jgi:hypothetical protein
MTRARGVKRRSVTERDGQSSVRLSRGGYCALDPIRSARLAINGGRRVGAKVLAGGLCARIARSSRNREECAIAQPHADRWPCGKSSLRRRFRRRIEARRAQETRHKDVIWTSDVGSSGDHAVADEDGKSRRDDRGPAHNEPPLRAIKHFYRTPGPALPHNHRGRYSFQRAILSRGRRPICL